MQITFFQLFSVLLRKHLLNHIRNRNIIKELIGVFIVCGLCIALKVGGGNGLSYIPVYMPLALMLFCRGSVLTWVAEKQQKHAQVQKIMGASFSAYLFSWITFFLLNGLFLSVVFIAVLSGAKVFSTMEFNQILEMLAIYFLLMLAIFGFCLMLSSFFSDAQLAAQVLTFLQLFGVALFFLLKIDSFRNSGLGLGFISIIPTVCFQFTSILINPSTNQYGPIPFTKQQGYIMLAIQSIVYFVLFLYFEKVIPNENGTHKHPLYFLRGKRRPQGSLEQKFELTELSSARFFEEDKQAKPVTCRIQNLQKSFSGKKVVNGLGLTLYKKQIFCLLGHNGAGKSTTINMLTGILKPDQGNINIFGLDYYNELAKIRQKVGVCLQTDVLYERLTVKEHLQFFGRMKGFFNDELNHKVNEIIEKCCLVTEVQKRAQTLSGGNKRKLCLACAAIGDSELIFLDQPSSGMDPNTRRLIWGMIEQLRQQGKTIVLTTHHLEEAEALSNRIGILASGQLMILGSCHYIKEKFGVGYNLKVNLQNFPQAQRATKKEEIREIVRKIVGSYRQDDQMATNQMKIILQTSHQENYPELFEFLESKKIQFSLTMSSLEDIFVRIGLDPESIINNEPIPEIEKVDLPKYQPHYNFFAQLNAVFVKKAFTILRSFSVFISLIMPTMYITIGAVISMIIGQNPSNEKQQYTIRWAKFYTLVYLMTIAYSFNTSSFCGSIVHEKEIKFKYMSFVMGMRKMPYWLGTLFFDMILFWVPSVILCIIIGCFPSDQNHIFVDKFGYFFILFLSFSLSFLPFTYLWTHAFQKSQTAYRFFPFFIMIIFAILPQIPIYIVPQNQGLKYILPILSPLLALVNGMVSQQMVGTDAYSYFSSHNTKIYTTPSIWYSIAVLLIQGAIYMTATIILDNLKFRLNDREHLSVDQMKSQRSEDLIKQQKKIQDMTDPSPIIVDSLYKKFPNGYVAIKDNSFSVQFGQTFGLLGPNGAGKSTTFNILTAADSKTHGKVRLLNTEVNRSVMGIFNEVGVCPQFNPIYDNLTVDEHLRFFGKLKGLTGDQLELVIEFYAKNLQLEEYIHQRAGTLSGGNKRKLCVCISLIGNPSLLFLDQPSAGVDAISRRYLWNILASSAQEARRAIILTTHSIHQAESLCKRIGILIKGQFICIGSPTELKKRYGKGYRINVRCEDQQKIQIVKQQMAKAYKDYEIQQNKEDFKISFLVPKGTFKFSEAFKLFYSKLYQSKIIKEYQIAENSLEEVFIHLSKLQPEPQDQNFKPTSKFCCWQRSQQGCRLIC